MIYRLIYLTFRLMSYIPLPLGRFTGRMLAVLFIMIPIKRNRISFENIESCFGERLINKDLKRLYRRVVCHFGQMMFEIPHIMRFTEENLDRYVCFAGEDNLTGAVSRDKGVFILTGHFGNWEWMSAAISLR